MAVDDRIFEDLAEGVPPDFLRALAYRESGLDPNRVNPTSRATGLFQITAPVLKDYNRANATSYALDDVRDPVLATKIAVFHIGRIIALWKPVPALGADFGDRRWLELLVLGWNAGPSAVLKVARRLTEIGVPPERITAASVNEAAQKMSPGSWIARPERLGFARLVAATYADRGARGRLVASLRGDTSDVTGPAVLAAALGVGAVVAAAKGAEAEA
jgi:hypothetical protein